MITEGQGVLVDFDLSKFLDANAGGKSQVEHTVQRSQLCLIHWKPMMM